MTSALAESARRSAKADSMRARGTDPFPHVALNHRDLIGEIIASSIVDRNRFHLAGRLVDRRKRGGVILFDLRDRSGTLPLKVDVAAVAGSANAEDWDIGDHVFVTGRHLASETGEVGLEVEEGVLLAKAMLRPATTDHELGRAAVPREVELIASESCRQLFILRAALTVAVRKWLSKRGFVEIETPILQELPGGASARPFSTYHNALGQDVSLRVSMELFLRRCTVGDLERVYELGRCFRNEGISRKHSPEFTLLEWSMAYSDYRDSADLAEEMVAHIVKEVLGRSTVKRDGHRVDLARPWRRVTLQQVILTTTGKDIMRCDAAELKPGGAAPGTSWGDAVRALYSDVVEPRLLEPTIVFDFPLDTHPCQRQSGNTPSLSESFDVVIGGVEVGSGGTEIADPDEQRDRFVGQRKSRGDQSEPHPNDQAYVNALRYGAPPSSGMGIGIDRLIMVLLEAASIHHVRPFPSSH